MSRKIFVVVEEQRDSFTLEGTSSSGINGSALADLKSAHEMHNPPTLLMPVESGNKKRFERLAARMAASQSSPLNCAIAEHVGKITLEDGDSVLVLHSNPVGGITGRRLTLAPAASSAA